MIGKRPFLPASKKLYRGPPPEVASLYFKPYDYRDYLYQPPWALDFSTRRRWLSEGDTHIAYIYELEDTSTFRYRIFNMAESLRANPSLGTSAGWFTRRDFHNDISFLDAADILVICRTRYDHGVAQLHRTARAHDILVLYDTDDLVFDPRLVHLIMHTLDVPKTEEEWDYWYAYTSRLGATMALCDGVLSIDTIFGRTGRRQTLPVAPMHGDTQFFNRRQTQEFRLASRESTLTGSLGTGE